MLVLAKVLLWILGIVVASVVLFYYSYLKRLGLLADRLIAISSNSDAITSLLSLYLSEDKIKTHWLSPEHGAAVREGGELPIIYDTPQPGLFSIIEVTEIPDEDGFRTLEAALLIRGQVNRIQINEWSSFKIRDKDYKADSHLVIDILVKIENVWAQAILQSSHQ